MSKHTQRGRHRAAAFHQTLTEKSDSSPSFDAMMSFIDSSLEQQYQRQEDGLKNALANGDKSYIIKSMVGNGADAFVDLRDRHPFSGEKLDGE